MTGVLGPKRDDEPALVIEPIIGWRSWKVVRTPDGPRLCSPQRETTWPCARPIKGECAHCSTPLAQRQCPCGINAFADAQTLMDEHPCYSAQPILGEVQLTGEVRGFERGWRAQWARPTRIWARSWRHQRTARVIARAYGIEYAGVAGSASSPWAEQRRSITIAFAAMISALLLLSAYLLLWPLPTIYEGTSQLQMVLCSSLLILATISALVVRYQPALMLGTHIMRATAAVGLLACAACTLMLLNSYSAASLPRPMQTRDLITRIEAAGAEVTYRGTASSLPPSVRSSVARENVELPRVADVAAHLGIRDLLAKDQTVCVQPRAIVWCFDGDEISASAQAARSTPVAEPWTVAAV